MIAFVRGRLASVEEGLVVLDTGGIGYEIRVPMSVISRLPGRGEEITLHTHLNVKEDEMSLYGFYDREELTMFRLLITVSGIGPKGALAVLSAMTPDDLRFAILSGDHKKLSKAPGIGPKTAQRLCMELRDKVSFELPGEDNDLSGGKLTASPEGENARDEAAAALAALGYSPSDAYRAVRGIDCEGKTTEQILKEALKKMSR